ncbi:glycoside hydrolase family 28 protein [Lophiostoma macrostomum CBS 122681]|uniref:Glycoside hydrolase family 28 protein n=1 Tax=Lophiostoma macrostomum CBS 122681 TaxID=1314788 RepID=A0A6A6SYV9_9PLEO|nr:glycoside hydrolase family 28 protein [Lophiostoma macrostomum CBS 122681]
MSLVHWTSLLFLLSAAGAFSRGLADPCIPTKSATDDEVPAINSALKECGNGGTIHIPESSVYQVASEVDFSQCHGCTFQVDGTLNISADWKKWTNTHTIFQLSNTRDIKIQGTGLINGNGLDMYGRWGYVIYNSTYAPLTFNITNASDINISGLRIQSPLGDVFKIKDATSISLSDISTKTGNDTLTNPNSVTTVDIASSSAIALSHLSIQDVYNCVSVQANSQNIHVSDVSCSGQLMGFVVDARIDVPAPAQPSNIAFSHLNISKALFATGFVALGVDVHATNVTWDDVRVDGVQSAVLITPCLGGTSTCWNGRGVQYQFENVGFGGYRGVATFNETVRCVAGNEGECGKVRFTDFFAEGTGG